MSVVVRPLTAEDVPAFLGLVQMLADYERIPGPDFHARERLKRDVLADPPPFRVLLAEMDGKVVAYSLYFFTYSSFLARPSLYVEDVFVLPEARQHGIARSLMKEMAREAVRRGCGRMEWTVLYWNEPAVAFYEGLGARIHDEWRVVRLTGEKLEKLAEI